MAELKFDKTGRLLFTKEMKKEYTILCPMMLPIHFELFVDVFRSYGYKAELLSIRIHFNTSASATFLQYW